MPHIGLDLDNTLIDYDAVFGAVAVELALLPEQYRTGSKTEIRQYLRARPDGERLWMRLQGQVYGRYIDRAALFDGAADFLRRLHEAGAEISIVSHKTLYGHYDPARVHLWDAARRWLESRGFFDAAALGLSRDRVHFEETREGKLARIAALRCDLFVDDLPEVLRHPAFPPGTRPLWFARSSPAAAGGGLTPYRTWQELTDAALRALPG